MSVSVLPDRFLRFLVSGGSGAPPSWFHRLLLTGGSLGHGGGAALFADHS